MYNLKNKNNKMVSIKHFYVECKQGGTYTILIRIVIRAIVPAINIRNSRNRYLIFFYTALKNTHLYTDITDYFSSKKKKNLDNFHESEQIIYSDYF